MGKRGRNLYIQSCFPSKTTGYGNLEDASLIFALATIGVSLHHKTLCGMWFGAPLGCHFKEEIYVLGKRAKLSTELRIRSGLHELVSMGHVKMHLLESSFLFRQRVFPIDTNSVLAECLYAKLEIQAFATSTGRSR